MLSRLSHFALWWRKRRGVLVGVGLLMAGLAALLLFLLMQATHHQEIFNQYYRPLVWVNIGVAVALSLIVLVLCVLLLRQLMRKRFGSRLLVKLASIFALVGVLPAVLVYVVSYQFVSRSIESWFDVRVEKALYAGLHLGQTTIDLLRQDWAQRTQSSAQQLKEFRRSSDLVLQLSRFKEQWGASQVELWSSSSVSLSEGLKWMGTSLNVERPAEYYFQLARTQGVVTWITGFDEAENKGDEAVVTIHALANVDPQALFALGVQERFLQISVPVASNLAQDALAVQQAYREYQERALGRQELRQMYIVTLTLAFILAVFGALLVAAILGNQLIKPLLMLAQGVKEVAKGNLTPRLAVDSKDEMGDLSRDFVNMTHQLSQAREEREQTVLALDHARASLQTILDNLSAGVMLLDKRGYILLSNPSAIRILGEAVAKDRHQEAIAPPETGQAAVWLAKVQLTFGQWLQENQAEEQDHWQHSFEMAIGPDGPQQQTKTLLARGALLDNGSRLLVFDDISDLVSAQRAQAWSEVARRLAHEIKNPLTPIQLSAERLAHRLKNKLEENDEAMLEKSVRVIVDQVQAMKRLVNEFRDFSRLPAPQKMLLQLNNVVESSLSLYENTSVPIVTQLAKELPLIMADPHQLQQVIHNLIQNAQDATLEKHGPEQALQQAITIETLLSATTGRVVLRIIDQGHGFADFVLDRAFEPYITTKNKGTGLGLAMVKKIADEHEATIKLNNRIDEHKMVLGAQISLSFSIKPIS